MDIIQRIVLVPWRPQRVFSYIFSQRSHSILNIVIPVLIIILCNFIVIELVSPISIQNSINHSVLEDMSIDEYIVMMKKAKLVSHVLSPIFTIGTIFILSFLVQTVGNTFSSNTIISYYDALQIVSLASITDVLGHIIRVPLIIYFKSTQIYFSFLLLMDNKTGFFANFLKYIDILIIWKFIIFGIGMYVLYNKNKKLRYIALSLFILFLYALIISLINSSFSDFKLI